MGTAWGAGKGIDGACGGIGSWFPGACRQFFSVLKIERRPRGASRSACRCLSDALKIERRPHGASRASSLPRLLQRTMACGISSGRFGRLAIYRGDAVGFDSIPRRTDKANNHGLTGIGTLQQTWERACSRCAARAALDLQSATKLKSFTTGPGGWPLTWPWRRSAGFG